VAQRKDSFISSGIYDVLFDAAKSTKSAFGEIISPPRLEQYFAIFVIPTGKETIFFSFFFHLFSCISSHRLPAQIKFVYFTSVPYLYLKRFAFSNVYGEFSQIACSSAEKMVKPQALFFWGERRFSV
jgi:hypothetical protein